MTIYEQKLWFDSCAGDTAVELLLFILMCGAFAIAFRYLRDWRPERSYERIRTYYVSLFICILWGVALLACAGYVFDFGWGRTVRLVLLGDNIEVQRCVARTGDRHIYPLSDVAFDYHFEESYSRMPGPGHHMLDIRHKQTGEQVARLEMREGFDVQALRTLAPRVWAAYQCQKGQRRARDECRVRSISLDRVSSQSRPAVTLGLARLIYAKSIRREAG
jgi:hypothetical protein